MRVEIEQPAERVTAREINQTIRYTSWVALKKIGQYEASQSLTSELEEFFAALASSDVVLRGAYDVSTLRADSDLLLWIHAETAENIQAAMRAFGRTEFGSAFSQVWSGTGLHRPAEFNKSHVPAFMAGAAPRDWLVIYPFVRSYEWYLLPEEDRRRMLMEHGMAGRTFTGILSNTVAAFALGDYEWMLALESNDLHEMVDMMRELRSTDARRHVREETPFYTGRRLEIADLGGHFA